MKKKLGVFLILGALCASMLAGCSFGGQTTAEDTTSDSASVVESTASSETAPVSSTDPEASSSTPEEDKPVPKLETYYQNSQGDSSALLMKITGDTNPAINAINAEIDELRADYEEDLRENDAYSWTEYVAIPSNNAKYLNLIVHNITYPTYGYQGEINAFIYDIENEKQISSNEALSMLNLTESGLQQKFRSYYNSITTNNQYRDITDFEVEGVVLYEDGSAAVFLQTETDDSSNMPMEYMTGSNSELYIYYTAENTFSIFNFTNF